MGKQFGIPVDTYHGHMCEAIKSLNSSLLLLQHADACEADDVTKSDLCEDAGMQSRYAFLLAANSLEAAANALLIGLETSGPLYEDLEKLPTLLKFEVVCLARGKTLDRGHNFYNCVKEVVRCRNEFVHPKPRLAAYKPGTDKFETGVDIKRTRSRRFPMAMEYVTPEHAKDAIGDILAFLAWVVFDVCGFALRDGTTRLGCGSTITTGDVLALAEEYGFDARTFGEPPAPKRPTKRRGSASKPANPASVKRARS